jgi:hypothetical protein
MRIPWFIVSPSLVLAQQSIAYALVPWSCARQTALPLHAVLAVTAALVAFASWTSWRAWRTHHGDERDTARGGVVEARVDFALGLDATLSLLSLVVVLAHWVAVFVLSPCH